MSYLTATDLHHGPPGPLDVLGDTLGTATNYRGPGQCPCTPVGAFGADDVTPAGEMTKVVLYGGIALTALYFVTRKRKR